MVGVRHRGWDAVVRDHGAMFGLGLGFVLAAEAEELSAVLGPVWSKRVD